MGTVAFAEGQGDSKSISSRKAAKYAKNCFENHVSFSESLDSKKGSDFHWPEAKENLTGYSHAKPPSSPRTALNGYFNF